MTMTLSPTHYQMLHQESGISDEVLTARGYFTVLHVRRDGGLRFCAEPMPCPKPDLADVRPSRTAYRVRSTTRQPQGGPAKARQDH